MKNTFTKLTTICLLIIASAIAAFAQTQDEKDVLKFIADYDQSYVNQDISFLEKNLADEYVYSNSQGESRNRMQTIEGAKKEIAKPEEKTVSFKSVNDSLRVYGNVAVASGSWTWSGTPLDNPQSEPHVDKGRYTIVLEKRGGKWLVVAEHFSDAPHDKKLLEAQVLKMGLAYNEMIVRGDVSEIGKILADEYFYTTTEGKFISKTEDLATFNDGKSKIESIETLEQKVRVVGNSQAVETGMIRVKGTNKEGKPFTSDERYTTTWVFRDLRWQIVSDHTSQIKK